MARVTPPGGSWPAVLSIPEIAYLWTENGGQAFAQVDAVAISLAESGGRWQVISPSADYGLWQINQIHFAQFGVNADTVTEPNMNARIAIALSGNGHNWGPWCTAWPGGQCPARAQVIGALQQGSPAFAQLPRVIAALGDVGGSIDAGGPVPSLGAITDAWTYLQDTLTRWGPGYVNNAVAHAEHLNQLR